MTVEKNVCAIISLYNPNLATLGSMIQNVSSQTDLVILVDNSPSSVDIDISKYKNVRIIAQDNTGITGAMNSGIKYASTSFDYFIFLDQDSFFSFDELAKFINDAISSNFSIVVPTIFSFDGRNIHEDFFNILDAEKKFSLIDRAQLSGMIVKYEVLESVGLFNEKYFLNLGDTEWCLRARKNGYNFHLNNHVKLMHDYGDGFSSLLGFKFFYGAPFRLHYRSRDSLRLIFSNVSPLKLKCKLIIKLLFTIFEILTLDSKLERYRFFFSGIIAFFKRESGIMKIKL